jgi:hypothetical protein
MPHQGLRPDRIAGRRGVDNGGVLSGHLKATGLREGRLASRPPFGLLHEDSNMARKSEFPPCARARRKAALALPKA